MARHHRPAPVHVNAIAPRRRARWLPAATVLAGVALAFACITPTAEAGLPKPPPPPPELDLVKTCTVLADVDAAVQQGTLVAVRHRYELTANRDPHAALAVALTQATDEERFRAFRERTDTHPKSVVGALGTCIVYAGWSKMGDMAARSCEDVRGRLGITAPIVDVAMAESALVHERDAEKARALLAPVLAATPNCALAAILNARARASGASPDDAILAWQEAAQQVPDCFQCLVAQAQLEEQRDAGPDGRARAAALWEQALVVAPEHPETLKRFAAVTVGVDDARALKAYQAAVKAGSRDVATVLATARLALALATTDAETAEAKALALRAVDVAKDDPDAHRLLLRALVRDAKTDAEVVAARAEGDRLLDLSPDDLVAHAALARLAAKHGPLADAVRHHHQLAGLVVVDHEEAVRIVGEEELTALAAEAAALQKQLLVDDAPLTGSPNTIAKGTQRGLQKLWRDHIKKGTTKGGALQVVVETNGEGGVADVSIAEDAIGNAEVAAATIAWLLPARFPKGARRYTLDFLLQ